jgi:hypothetical protein
MEVLVVEVWACSRWQGASCKVGGGCRCFIWGNSGFAGGGLGQTKAWGLVSDPPTEKGWGLANVGHLGVRHAKGRFSCQGVRDVRVAGIISPCIQLRRLRCMRTAGATHAVAQTASMPRQPRLDEVACRFDPSPQTQPGDRGLRLKIEKWLSISSAFRSRSRTPANVTSADSQFVPFADDNGRGRSCVECVGCGAGIDVRQAPSLLRRVVLCVREPEGGLLFAHGWGSNGWRSHRNKYIQNEVMPAPLA